MEISVAGWAVVAQSIATGFIGALSYQHWATWRADRSKGGAFWLMAWSGTLGVLFLVNGLLPAQPAGPVTDVGLFLRSQLIGASLLLAVPALKSVTHGPRIRWYVASAGAMMLARAVLWLSTDLLYTHTLRAGLPVYGPLLAVTLFPPLAVVAWYTAVAIAGMPAGKVRNALRAAGLISLLVLVTAYVMPSGRVAELLLSVWAVPVVVALQTMKVLRTRTAEQNTRRQHGMRDALAQVGNAGWFTTDPDALLAVAESAARMQLADATITGSIHAVARGQFVTDFRSTLGGPDDDLARGFLEDLRRIVSTAAERSRLAAELRDAAFTDSLTRLPNRHALERYLTESLGRAADQGAPVGVLYCDLDGFKGQNDQHGHAWGDALLRRTAAHLQDQTGTAGFVARFGGDEFVVVVDGAGPLPELLELAGRLRTGPERTGPGPIPPLVSVGLAIWSPGDRSDAEQLLREADMAMVEAKRHPGGVVAFDDGLRAQMGVELSLRRDLDAALLNDEFELHYQPIVDASTLAVVGVEALVRWQHPDGVRMPVQWLAFAEESGLIVPIGRRLVVAARAGARLLGLPVAVNFAARQLAEPQFLEHLLADWVDDWHLLTLEITESALLQDLAHVIESLTAVRALGARVSIDDFGTGYSSFARLATLPVDVLKIDQAFVRDLDGPGGVAVVRAIVALAEAYGLDIIAEGVERVDQLERLVTLGVPKLQGYLLGRPAASAPRPVRLPAAGLGPRRRAALAASSARGADAVLAADGPARPVPPFRRAASG